MRPITEKQVQVHRECVCGYNEVYNESVKTKWSALHLLSIKRKKDKRTGRPFLLWHFKLFSCEQCCSK